MNNVTGSILGSHTVGKSIKVELTGRREVMVSLRGNVAYGDLTVICRAINDGVRWQEQEAAFQSVK